ncbi:MAG TPA: heparan-alpha-glucosaminide N-acetyltransferase domain-containing protein [Puia sp.]|nr:heparan-alpha-glucosaminide N-acetyltransferase domain-containing protein [Puia sp.]
MNLVTTKTGLDSRAASGRIRSVDILRGLIMVLMAIDHVRVYSGLPAGGNDVGIFLTRWITNFSAPGFAFFAGTGAYLYGQKLKNTDSLSRYLFTRGLFIVILELTLLRFGWTFNFSYSSFTLAGVLWMLGWCMVIMAVMVRMKPVTVGIIGLAIIAFQQVFRLVPLVIPPAMRQHFGWFWEFIYSSRLDSLPGIAVLYVIVPWIGVMAAGYGFGKILLLPQDTRHKACRMIGIAAILVYLVVGTIVILMQPHKEGSPPFIFQLLRQQKYPASQLFLLMTLGPLILLIPWAEKARGFVARTLDVFGRVPLFFYIMHIFLIHGTALAANWLIKGSTHQEWYSTAPFTEIDKADQWALVELYIVYIIDLIILYFFCDWYADLKSRHRDNKWLRYV